MSNTSTTKNRSWQDWFVLALFVGVVLGAGAIIGIAANPGAWYAGLNKPFFNPPNWIFGPVWTVLYIAIAVAGWRVWVRDPHSPAMKFWVGQMVLNWLWSPMFFSLQQLWPALIVIAAVWLSIVGFMLTARRIDRVSSWLFAPYLVWVSFATALNLSLAVLN